MYLLPERSYSTLDHIHCVDALTMLRALPSDYVDLAVYDFPYMGVKEDAWDNQWKTVADYLAWLQPILRETKRVLKPNGSFYAFASPQMSARVEIAVQEHFNVLTRITWQKPPYSTKAEMFDKDTMRSYFPASESIIFAEQYGSDAPYQGALIDGNSTYWGACETVKRSVFGDYLTIEFYRAGASRREIAALFPSASGGLTGCVSNWILGYNCPTPEQYQTMRQHLNNRSAGEFLRREYEDLRREYEDLRRPFYMNEKMAYTDVWTFKTVNTYPGKHPCEKPLEMMQHIVKVSSRPSGIVLDCFAGSGATLDAARRLGRKYIGCDMDAGYVRKARARLATPYMLSMFNLLPAKVEPPVFSVPVQQPLFAALS